MTKSHTVRSRNPLMPARSRIGRLTATVFGMLLLLSTAMAPPAAAASGPHAQPASVPLVCAAGVVPTASSPDTTQAVGAPLAQGATSRSGARYV